MLIASVSDLHTDFPENRDAVVKLATEIHRGGAHIVVVAGDISHRKDRIDRALRAFSEVADIVAYVPGNHDLWFNVLNAPKRTDLNTWHRYRTELLEVSEAAGAHYLPAAPLCVNGVAIVGSCGWYDYSFSTPALLKAVDPETLAKKKWGGLRWSDARFIAFRNVKGDLMSDAEVTEQMALELRAHLERTDQDPSVRHVIAVTHHQPYYETVNRTGHMAWEFFNAYMGSTRLGAAIDDAKKVRVAVYGHTHIVGGFEIGGRRVYGTPLGYPRERKGIDETELLSTRIGWIDSDLLSAP